MEGWQIHTRIGSRRLDGEHPELALAASIDSPGPERWGNAEQIYHSVGANVVFQFDHEGLSHRPSLQTIRDTKSLFRKAVTID